MTVSFMKTVVLATIACVLLATTAATAFQYNTNGARWPFKVTITSPSAAAGDVFYYPANFGPSVPTGGLVLPLRYPNSADAATGCVAKSTPNDDFGASYSGSALLIKRGTCVFDTKAQIAAASYNASLLVVWNSNDNEELLSMDGLSSLAITIPAIMIGPKDAGYLMTQISNAATTGTGTGKNVYLSIPGAGPIASSELTAINSIVKGINFTADGETSLQDSTRTWDTQLAAPSRDPCSDRLHGIWCENGHVTSFELVSVNFAAGNLPAAFNDLPYLKLLIVRSNLFTGAVPALNQLTQLAVLDISLNSFTSIPDAAMAGKVNTLASLIAGSNQITSISTSIPNLTQLQILDLSDNLLSSSLPSLANMPSLQKALLNDNSFTGSLTRFRGYSGLTSLSVRNNKLSGTIDLDHFDDCPSLTSLDLAHNSFSAPLPHLNNTINILSLDLSYNSFTGVLPDLWANLASLTSLILSNNYLVSPFADTTSNMGALVTMDLSYNQFTTGDPSFAGVVFPALSDTVQQAYFSHNNFTGTYDPFYCCSSSLTELDVSYNAITTLPSDLWSTIAALTLFDVSHNAIVGTIPSGLPTTKQATLKFNGNSGLKSGDGTLPSWVVTLSDSLTKAAGTSYVCPSFTQSQRLSAAVTFDASYYDYSLCTCDSGTYGEAPNCKDIPAVVATSTNVNGTNYALITDAGYGSSRVKEGMDTAWLLNSTAMLMASGTYNPARPPLGVIVTFSFTSAFAGSTSNSMGVYQGDTNLLGTRVAFFVGDGTGVAYNTTVWVVTPVATVNFQSREQSGTHFSAQVAIAYTCPDGYSLSAGACMPSNSSKYRGFQSIFGVLVLICQIITTLASTLLLYVKRTEKMVGLQSQWLLALSILGFFFIIEPPLTGIVNDQFPCGVTYWFDLLWQPILLTCVLMIMGRLYVFHEIQKARKRLLNKQKMDPKRTARLTLLGRIVQPRNQLYIALAAMAGPLLVVIISYGVAIGDYKSPNKNCREDYRLDVIQLIYWIVYDLLVIFGLVNLKNARDAFGVSRRVGQFAMYYTVISIVYFVLKFAARDSQINPFDFRYLEWLIVVIFQFSFIIRPLLRTFPLFQRAIDDKDVEPLDQMLATKLGFAYIKRHCEEEFSVENVLCWQAIDKFQKKTTVAGFQDIIQKFIGPDAHMQVNISRQMEKNILAIKPTELDGLKLQSSLDPVKEELFNLILRDSYPRFLASPLAKRYVNKLPLDNHDPDGPSVSGPGGTGTGGSDDSHGSRGGGVTSQVEMEEKKTEPTTAKSAPLLDNQGSSVSINVSTST